MKSSMQRAGVVGTPTVLMLTPVEIKTVKGRALAAAIATFDVADFGPRGRDARFPATVHVVAGPEDFDEQGRSAGYAGALVRAGAEVALATL
jgi:hypothetical protein